MMKYRRRIVRAGVGIMAAALLICPSICSSADQAPGDPMVLMKSIVDQSLTIISDPSCKADQDRCREKLRTLVETNWDKAEMARSALGTHWREINDQQREQFTVLFSSLTEDLYLTTANLTKAQEKAKGVQVTFIREISEGDGYMQVNSTVALEGQDRPISVNYRLKLNDGRWMVYDIIVADISLVGNYRNQFNRVINSKGFPTLINELDQKVKQLNAGGPPNPA
jgi:phospholipid transport system substrate-binding protein